MVNQRAEMGLVSHSTLPTGLFRPSWNCLPHPSLPPPSFCPVHLPSPSRCTLHLNLAPPPFRNPFSLPLSSGPVSVGHQVGGEGSLCVSVPGSPVTLAIQCHLSLRLHPSLFLLPPCVRVHEVRGAKQCWLPEQQCFIGSREKPTFCWHGQGLPASLFSLIPVGPGCGHYNF